MKRKIATEVHIGNLIIGGSHPIRVQSMTNTPTEDVAATVAQIRKLYEARCEIVRLAIPNLHAVEALKKIKQQLLKDKINIPIVADTHFSPSIALACMPFADKVRINPGNFHNRWDAFRKLLQIAQSKGHAIRLGINQGSLAPEIISQFGHGAEAMYQSVLPFLQIVRSESFSDLVLSFKSGNVAAMVTNNIEIIQKLDVQGFSFPIHLGVTEAGNGSMARIKSAIGIGSLLLQGIGDTLRVSLTENPENEVPVAYEILQACGKRITQTEYIACPSCGRTQFDIQKVLREIKAKTANLAGGKIAIMGCIVNGLGELAEADFGCIGTAPGKVNLYAHGVCVKTHIPEATAADELVAIINMH